MLDRQRILGKLGELDSYLRELMSIAPKRYEEYEASLEKRRACERLLHISIECAIDICNLLVSGMRLGLPSGEEDLFVKLQRAGLFSSELTNALRRMRAFRNILVHRYGTVDDRLVYDVIASKLGDFEEFRDVVLAGIRTSSQEGEEGLSA